MTTKPYPFQRVGVDLIHYFDGRVILADDMGLGKSFQSLLYTKEAKAWSILVVCPSSLKVNWEREAWKHVGFQSHILEGLTPHRFNLIHPVVIINYQILRGWIDELLKIKWRTLIIDEAHNIANPGTKQSKLTKLIARECKRIICITGTPFLNRVIELFPSLNLVRPDVWDSRTSFAELHCKPVYKPWGWEYKGAENLPLLNRKMKRYCFPYQTLIESEQGSIPIGDLVDNAKEIKVLSVNPETSQVQWRSVKAYSKRTAPSEMVRIKHKFGELICTPDHPIWTEEGYKRASEIKTEVYLSVVQKGGNKDTCKSSKILLSEMCHPGKNSSRRGIKENNCNSLGLQTTSQGCDLCKLSRTFQEANTQCNFLLKTMLRKRETPFTRKEIQNTIKVLSNLQCTNNPESAECIFQEETETQILQQILCSYSLLEHYRPNSSIHPNLQSAEISASSLRLEGTTTRIFSPNLPPARTFQEGASAFYQAGFGSSQIQISHRDRRKDTQLPQTKTLGQAKGKITKRSRVDSVEVLERGSRYWPWTSCQENTVYDIEVEDNHNFFADGVLVHNCMVRRLYNDVFKEMPAHSRIILPVKIPNMKEYREAERDFIGWLTKKSLKLALKARSAERLMRFGYLRRLACTLKQDPVAEWIDLFLRDTDEKLLLFSPLNAAILLPMYEKYHKQSVLVTGKVKGWKRQALFDQFNEDKHTRLLFGNTDAAGQGWNCTATSTVAHIGLCWNPSKHDQADKRVRGIGRGVKGHPSRAWYIVAQNTVEEDLCHLIQKTQEHFNQAIDGQDTENEFDLFTQLEERLLRRAK